MKWKISLPPRSKKAIAKLFWSMPCSTCKDLICATGLPYGPKGKMWQPKSLTVTKPCRSWVLQACQKTYCYVVNLVHVFLPRKSGTPFNNWSMHPCLMSHFWFALERAMSSVSSGANISSIRGFCLRGLFLAFGRNPMESQWTNQNDLRQGFDHSHADILLEKLPWRICKHLLRCNSLVDRSLCSEFQLLSKICEERRCEFGVVSCCLFSMDFSLTLKNLS